MTTLVMKLIATDNAPFTLKQQAENKRIIQLSMTALLLGVGTFDDIKKVANALNYVHGFNQHGLIDGDIEEEHNAAARALAAVTKRAPYKLNKPEHDQIQVILNYWSDILEVASQNLVRTIQHEIDTTSEAAQARRSVERLQTSRRSHRKPKKKAKK